VGKNTSVFGIYTDSASAERAVEALKAAGFSNNDISALFPDKQGTKDFAHEKNTKAPEGATAGAGTGAVLGGGLGWLAGIGALAIPGLGPFIAAGPIMAALAGAGVGGASPSLNTKSKYCARLKLRVPYWASNAAWSKPTKGSAEHVTSPFPGVKASRTPTPQLAVSDISAIALPSLISN